MKRYLQVKDIERYGGRRKQKKPLSDERLTELLQQKGYNIARRTVAKYREQQYTCCPAKKTIMMSSVSTTNAVHTSPVIKA